MIWGSGVGAPGGEASLGRARRSRLGLLWDGRSPDTRLILPATTAPTLQSGAGPHNMCICPASHVHLPRTAGEPASLLSL